MAVGVVLLVTVSHIHRKFLHSYFCDPSDPRSLEFDFHRSSPPIGLFSPVPSSA